MRNVTFAATQFACSWDAPANIAKALITIPVGYTQVSSPAQQ